MNTNNLNLIIPALVITVLAIGLLYYCFKIQHEPFTDNSDLIFNKYITNKGAQSSYETRYVNNTPQLFKKLGGMATTFLGGILDNTADNDEPVTKCLSCEGIFNKMVYFKQGPIYYLGSHNSQSAITNVKLLSKANMSASEFMKCCRWKLVIGLSGDANTCSILHVEQDAYITRLPNGSIILQPAEVVHGNELMRQMATFHLIDGVDNRKFVSIMGLPIGRETRKRIVEVNAHDIIHMIEYIVKHVNDYKASTFECVDVINEYPIFTNRNTINYQHKCINISINEDLAHNIKNLYYENKDHNNDSYNIDTVNLVNDINNLDLCQFYKNNTNLPRTLNCDTYVADKDIMTSVLEPFQDSSNGPNRHCNKSSGKRLLASCVEKGEITPSELSKNELFQNVDNPKPQELYLFGDDFDPTTANIFDKHTGAEFNAILNTGVSKKRKELTDNIFYKLENAKMDPDVNNLLDYNESRYNIYKKENNDFEGKIYDRIKKNTTTVDNLIIDMNNYRIKNMAQDFFFLGDKLIRSRGTNNTE